MQLQPHDQHWVYSKAARTLQAWDANHQRIFSAEVRNRTTNEGSFAHDGNLPYGEYIFGTPIPKNLPAFGPLAIPILDAPGHRELASRGRAGLMLHGGGSGLPDPMAEVQSPPWVPTHGCLRGLNRDVRAAADLIDRSHSQGGVCFLTNVLPNPGAAAEEPGDYLDVDESMLDPSE